MASIITATTSSGLTQSADNSGVLQLASGVGNLVTVPSVTGTAMVSGNMPAFSAYLSGNQSISNNTLTKVTFQSEEFDTANAYDNSTNYRFQPLVAGYYFMTSHLFYNLGVSSIIIWNYLYKNGSLIKQFNGGGTNSAGYFRNELNALVYMNGTTDYLEVYTQQNSGSSQNLGSGGGVASTWFSGVLVRAA